MVTELETKTENVWMQHNKLLDHFIKRKWQKRHGGKNIVVELTSFFSYKWHKSRFFRYRWDKSQPCWRWQKCCGGSGKNVAKKKWLWEKSCGILTDILGMASVLWYFVLLLLNWIFSFFCLQFSIWQRENQILKTMALRKSPTEVYEGYFEATGIHGMQYMTRFCCQMSSIGLTILKFYL